MKNWLISAAAVLLLLFLPGMYPAEKASDKPIQNKNTMTELATFGGGCFWCTEAIYQRLKGVETVMPGYSGGKVKNPTYKEVCTGLTGHAEVVQIKFDPAVISYTELLKVFFATHDPTTLNRQGADVGTQYRSVIFYHNTQQQTEAAEVINALNEEKVWSKSIVTEIVPFEAFYPAEDYHKDYFTNNPNSGYCRMVIQPKVSKFEKAFEGILR